MTMMRMIMLILCLFLFSFLMNLHLLRGLREALFMDSHNEATVHREKVRLLFQSSNLGSGQTTVEMFSTDDGSFVPLLSTDSISHFCFFFSSDFRLRFFYSMNFFFAEILVLRNLELPRTLFIYLYNFFDFYLMKAVWLRLVVESGD